MTIDAIVEQCQRTRFLLEDAETLIRSDLSAVLLREHQELSSHFGVVDSLAVRLELACASAKFGLVCINAMLRAALLGWARLNALIGRENSFAMALT